MDFASEWSKTNIHDRKLALSYFVNSVNNKNHPDYLNIVKAPKNWGVFASNGPNFKYAVFGRDSLVVADDLLNTHKELVHEIILFIAKLQGTTTNDDSEEEPGKIHHEYRSLKYDGITVPEYSQGILRNLQRLWGEEGSDIMIYYGGYDATPLYIRLVCKYIEQYGESILQETYIGRDNLTHDILGSVRHAIGWLTYKINESNLGLLEYKRINPHGIENQAWKDSRTGYLKRDGSMPNFNYGIASIEIQGYVYDAILLASKIIAENDEQRAYWESLAYSVSEKVISWFWMEDVKYFAQAIFIDENNNRQQIDTLTSNGALILNSQIITNLRPADREYYLTKISETIMNKNFLNNAGIRSRSLIHESIPGFIDYHGSYTVWHKETNEIAKGFRINGLNNLANILEKRIIDTVAMSGEFSEFHYVDIDDKIWYDNHEAVHYFSQRSPGGNLPIPEPGQAWTISSVYRICLNENLLKSCPANNIENIIFKKYPYLKFSN